MWHCGLNSWIPNEVGDMAVYLVLAVDLNLQISIYCATKSKVS